MFRYGKAQSKSTRKRIISALVISKSKRKSTWTTPINGSRQSYGPFTERVRNDLQQDVTTQQCVTKRPRHHCNISPWNKATFNTCMWMFALVRTGLWGRVSQHWEHTANTRELQWKLDVTPYVRKCDKLSEKQIKALSLKANNTCIHCLCSDREAYAAPSSSASSKKPNKALTTRLRTPSLRTAWPWVKRI